MKPTALSRVITSGSRARIVVLALGALAVALCAVVATRPPGAPFPRPMALGAAGGEAKAREYASATTVMVPPAAQDAAGGAAAAPAEATIERRIITTGRLELAVSDVTAATRQLEAAVTAAGGWIASRESGSDADGRRTASIAARIPAAQFDAVTARLASLGDVTRDAKQTEDVGKAFVDLEARRRNLVREEAVITGLFARNGRIGDVLEVERELARVRGEIEQVEGELRYLGNQESYSTLTVALAPRAPVLQRRVETWSLGYHAARAARALLVTVRSMTTVLLYLTIVLGPFAVVIAAATWLVRRARRPEAAA